MVEITQLIEPTTLDTSLALFIGILLVLIAYIGLKLRHGIIIFMLMICISIFMLVIIIGFEFIWFWTAILLTYFMIGIAGIWRFLLKPITNDK